MPKEYRACPISGALSRHLYRFADVGGRRRTLGDGCSVSLTTGMYST